MSSRPARCRTLGARSRSGCVGAARDSRPRWTCRTAWRASSAGSLADGILDASSGYPFSVDAGRHTFTFYDSGTRVASTSGSATTNRAVFTGPSTAIGHARRTERGVDWFTSDERAL